MQIPPAADKLRRILNLAQVVQSHALSFFHLSSPDFLLGMDGDPATRNIFGMMESHPSIARDGIRLRRFGQQIIEWFGGKRIHPAWVVPGGVSEPLSAEKRDQIVELIPEAKSIVLRTLDWFKRSLENYREEIQCFANFPTLFLGLVKPEGGITFYTGKFRIMDASGKIIADQIDPSRYQEIIGEAVEPWSYLKFPYYKPMGYPAGIYRVGPLARINIADMCGTPLADQEKAEFHSIQRTPVLSSFYFHYARLIEALYCVERMEMLLNDPEILSQHVPLDRRAQQPRRNRCGRGAPRHPDSPLQDRRERPDALGQSDHRHGPQQPGDEPRRAAGRPTLRQRGQDRGRNAESRGSRDSHLRSLPELLDPRIREDASEHPAGRARRDPP